MTLALALLSTASPTHDAPGVAIPFQKRRSLTKADGTFDYVATIKHGVKIAKYAQLPMFSPTAAHPFRTASTATTC